MQRLRKLPRPAGGHPACEDGPAQVPGRGGTSEPGVDRPQKCPKLSPEKSASLQTLFMVRMSLFARKNSSPKNLNKNHAVLQVRGMTVPTQTKICRKLRWQEAADKKKKSFLFTSRRAECSFLPMIYQQTETLHTLIAALGILRSTWRRLLWLGASPSPCEGCTRGTGPASLPCWTWRGGIAWPCSTRWGGRISPGRSCDDTERPVLYAGGRSGGAFRRVRRNGVLVLTNRSSPAAKACGSDC